MDNRRNIQISVIVCTRNRAASLARTIQSLVSQRIDPSSYDIVIVDNDSTDNTKDVVECFAGFGAPRVRYVFEPKQGLSHARNLGIKSAKGEIVVFTDDDLELSPLWLGSIRSGFERYKCTAIQGRILLRCDPLPPWFPDEYLDFLARVDRGNGDFRWDRTLIGANMAFTRGVFERFGSFDIRLGAGQSGAYEDTEFSNRLRQDPTSFICYVGSAHAYHEIPPSRMTKSYFRTRLYQQGRSWAIRYAREKSSPGVWAYALSSLCRATFLSVFQTLCGNRKSAFLHEGHIFYYVGVLTHLYFSVRCSLKVRWEKVVARYTSVST